MVYEISLGYICMFVLMLLICNECDLVKVCFILQWSVYEQFEYILSYIIFTKC